MAHRPNLLSSGYFLFENRAPCLYMHPAAAVSTLIAEKDCGNAPVSPRSGKLKEFADITLADGDIAGFIVAEAG